MKKHKLLKRLAAVLMITLLLICTLPVATVGAEPIKTTAGTEQELRDAIERACATIVLANDLELSECLVLDYSVTL